MAYNQGFTEWKFNGVVEATEQDVASNKTMRDLASNPSDAPAEISVGQKLANISMRNDSYRNFTGEDLKSFFETAQKFPDEKSHQVNALKQAAAALDVELPRDAAPRFGFGL
jgi:hypothetical protein